ncbi:MAG: 50S ribosomal protein L9 [Spirochaetaceae bacterium]|jgi:large subunit ribosomal protein L9|nr:50S ribosomal protein L9 [Spirochaetaceae bacterium]
MKVILNQDLATMGEEGDVKDVARGFARNFLFPRDIAVPYNPVTIAIFEARKDEIEKRKEQKRQDAGAIKARLEVLEIMLTMPAGANGKLYGAVTGLTISDELDKQGFQIERKRIEIPGNTIKSVGKYKIGVKLYGNVQAEVSVAIAAPEVKQEESGVKDKRRRHHSRENEGAAEPAAGSEAYEPVSAASEEAAASGEAAVDDAPSANGPETAASNAAPAVTAD